MNQGEQECNKYDKDPKTQEACNAKRMAAVPDKCFGCMMREGDAAKTKCFDVADMKAYAKGKPCCTDPTSADVTKVGLRLECLKAVMMVGSQIGPLFEKKLMGACAVNGQPPVPADASVKCKAWLGGCVHGRLCVCSRFVGWVALDAACVSI